MRGGRCRRRRTIALRPEARPGPRAFEIPNKEFPMFRRCDPPRASRPLALLAMGALLLGSLTVAWADVPTTVPSPGLRESTPGVVAFKNARLVLAPGRVVPKGTLVVRDGVITAAGAGVPIPADAVQIDLAGKTIYAGLIDGYSTVGQ